MRSKAGTFCMILGAVLVLAALSLFVYNRIEEQQAEKASSDALSKVIAAVEEKETPDSSKLYEKVMTEVEIDGYLYIGYLTIPMLNLELPVMSEWNYAQLKMAPCRYTGSIYTDDLVIAAHNYKRHFGSISSLHEEDTVIFTDMEGISTAYAVKSVDVLSPTAIEEMTSGEYDLTLFTCTYGGKSRVTVRCMRQESFRNP